MFGERKEEEKLNVELESEEKKGHKKMRKIAFLIHYVVFGEKSIGSARFSSIQRSNAVNVNRMSFSSSTMWPAVSQVHLRRSE